MLITIDRFEGSLAICEMEDGGFLGLPKGFLPEGAREGSILRIELDVEGEEKDRERIRKKMSNLFKE